VRQAAAYLRMLYEDPQARAGYGERGKAHIRAHFSIERCGERMRERLNEIP
jgi:hypothetical protein